MPIASVQRDGTRAEEIAGMRVDRLPVGVSGAASTAWWGMVFFMLTEATLFACLFFSYFYIGSRHSQWPANGAPELKLAILNTDLLVLSSIPMWLAERVARRGRDRLFAYLLAVVLFTGVAFLVVEAVEWSRQSFTPATDAYSSLFFTITGFHFAHVTLGLFMILELLYRALAGAREERRDVSVKNVAAYWHFVGLVWVFLFLTIYISPRVL